jgi:excisionase family DNA binding protein
MSAAVAVVSPGELLALVRQAVREELDRREGGATLSTEDAASIAKRDPKTIRRWLASGELPSTKRGRVHRIRREDLDRFLAGGRADAAVDRIVASLG